MDVVWNVQRFRSNIEGRDSDIDSLREGIFARSFPVDIFKISRILS